MTAPAYALVVTVLVGNLSAGSWHGDVKLLPSWAACYKEALRFAARVPPAKEDLTLEISCAPMSAPHGIWVAEMLR
jgi:hypothetical protein